MDRHDVVELKLRARGIRPSAQRMAVADQVLFRDDHPSAERIWKDAQKRMPLLSRATVYNTLHLFVKKGLLRAVTLAENKVVYDPNLERHHHFIDQKTGEISDIGWDYLTVQGSEKLPGFEIAEYSVVLRGRRTKSRRG